MMNISQQFKAPLRTNVFAQLLVIFFAGMLLDGGMMLKVAVISAAVYWFSILLIVFRRRMQPTRTDLLGANAGFAALIALTLIFSPLVSFLRHGS